MKFKKTLFLSTALIIGSCTSKPDSTNGLYAFETAEAARKGWSISAEDKPKTDNDTHFELGVDSLHTDSLIETLKN